MEWVAAPLGKKTHMFLTAGSELGGGGFENPLFTMEWVAAPLGKKTHACKWLFLRVVVECLSVALFCFILNFNHQRLLCCAQGKGVVLAKRCGKKKKRQEKRRC